MKSHFLLLPSITATVCLAALTQSVVRADDLVKAKDGSIKGGNAFGTAGYAPFHDLDSKVPADVKAEMEKINAGLLDGSIKTNVPPVKP